MDQINLDISMKKSSFRFKSNNNKSVTGKASQRNDSLFGSSVQKEARATS